MIKILLAEDDGALRGLVRTTLTDDGYEVTACHDGSESRKQKVKSKKIL